MGRKHMGRGYMGRRYMTGGADIRSPSQQTPGVSVKWPLVGKIVSLQSVIRLYKENLGNRPAPGMAFSGAAAENASDEKDARHKHERPTRGWNREVASWR